MKLSGSSHQYKRAVSYSSSIFSAFRKRSWSFSLMLCMQWKKKSWILPRSREYLFSVNAVSSSRRCRNNTQFTRMEECDSWKRERYPDSSYRSIYLVTIKYVNNSVSYLRFVITMRYDCHIRWYPWEWDLWYPSSSTDRRRYPWMKYYPHKRKTPRNSSM